MSKFRFVDEPVQRPIRVYQPGDAPAEPQLRGWTVRERGDTSGVVTHSYRCPVHGLFDVEVQRSAVPDEVLCTHKSHILGVLARWAGSFCGQGKAAGEVDS